VSKLPLSKRKAGEEARGKDKVGECPKKYGAQRNVEVDKIGLLLTYLRNDKCTTAGSQLRKIEKARKAACVLSLGPCFENRPRGRVPARELREPPSGMCSGSESVL